MEGTTENHYEATISGEKVTKPGIDYYLMAADTHEARAYDGSDMKPHHIEIDSGLFSFEDTFDLRPRPEWDTTDGRWTVIDHEFTPLETGGEKWYEAKLDVPRLANCTIETDVKLGGSIDGWYYTAVSACESGEEDSHNVRLKLLGYRHNVKRVEMWVDAYKVIDRDVSFNCPVRAKISISNSIITAYVNDEQVAQFFDQEYQGVSHIKLSVYYKYDGQDRDTFDNFLVEEMPVDRE